MVLSPLLSCTLSDDSVQHVELPLSVTRCGSWPVTVMTAVRVRSLSMFTWKSRRVYTPVAGTLTCSKRRNPSPSRLPQSPMLRTMEPPEAPGYRSTHADPPSVLPGASASNVIGPDLGGADERGGPVVAGTVAGDGDGRAEGEAGAASVGEGTGTGLRPGRRCRPGGCRRG